MKNLIIGSGVIGKATGELLESLNHEVEYVDVDDKVINKLKKENKSIGKIENNYDLFWVCTAEWNVDEVVDSVSKFGEYIVIRSTITPDVIDKLQNKHPSVVFAHIPEFLREKTALTDIFNEDRIVIGINDVSGEMKKRLMNCFDGIFCKKVFCSFQESSLIKLTANAWLAMQISFWNEMKLFFDKFDDVNPQLVANAVTLDKRISKYGSNMIGKPFSGFCFPKDTLALYNLFDEHESYSNMMSSCIFVNTIMED